MDPIRAQWERVVASPGEGFLDFFAPLGVTPLAKELLQLMSRQLVAARIEPYLLAPLDERIVGLVAPAAVREPLTVRELFEVEMPKLLSIEQHRWRWANLGLVQFDVRGDGGIWCVDFDASSDWVRAGSDPAATLRTGVAASDLIDGYVGRQPDLLRLLEVESKDSLGKLQKAISLFNM